MSLSDILLVIALGGAVLGLLLVWSFFGFALWDFIRRDWRDGDWGHVAGSGGLLVLLACLPLALLASTLRYLGA